MASLDAVKWYNLRNPSGGGGNTNKIVSTHDVEVVADAIGVQFESPTLNPNQLVRLRYLAAATGQAISNVSLYVDNFLVRGPHTLISNGTTDEFSFIVGENMTQNGNTRTHTRHWSTGFTGKSFRVERSTSGSQTIVISYEILEVV